MTPDDIRASFGLAHRGIGNRAVLAATGESVDVAAAERLATVELAEEKN